MADAPARPAVPAASSSPILMLMLMFVMLWILFDSSLRNAIGTLVGLVLMPAIGMEYKLPLISICAAGVISITFSTVVRHLMVDWVSMARINKRMSALRKESFAAMKRRDMNRVEQLNKIQRDNTQESMGMMMTQMKPTMITMIFVIGGFTWLWLFISESPYHFFSVPWQFSVDFSSSTLLPNWILLYSLLTMPVGQILGRALKYISYSQKLKKLGDAPQ